MNSEKNLYYVCWYMTYYCNLECEYCYAFKNKINNPLDTLVSVGSELINQGIKKINLTGGEPFASKHLLEIIDTFHSKIDLSITTNGTIGTKEQLIYIKGKLERITISIDSVDAELGKLLRSKKCDTHKILQFASDAIELGFKVKINTVVSKMNKMHLRNIGNWLMQFPESISWKLFQITDNPNVESSINGYLISNLEFENIVLDMAKQFPMLKIQKASSEDLNHNYIIVTPEGGVQVPYLLGYKPIGNVLQDNIYELLEQNNYSFELNKSEFNKKSIQALSI